jgi:hypothetical protein
MDPTVTIDVANSNRQSTVLALKASLANVPSGDLLARVTILVNGLEVASPWVTVHQP